MRIPTAKIWMLGTRDTPPALRRRVMLVNQLALFGAVATIPYQLFYALTSLSYYAPVLASNTALTAGYLWAIWANHRRRHDSARDLVVVVAMAQLAVVTWYVGRDVGVHLFYFPIVGILPLLFGSARIKTLLFLAASSALLFWICDRNFGYDRPRLDVSQVIQTIGFGFSVAAAVALLAALMMLFYQQIESAEKNLMASNQELSRLSATDVLTQLPNRRAVETFMARWSTRPNAVVGVVLCDVDYFKLYNDHYGHLRGDETLSVIGESLRDSTRSDFDLVARYGGEEFIVLLPQANQAYVKRTVERLRAAVEALAITHRYRPDSLGVVTVSIGYSQLENRGEPGGPVALDAIDVADKALYRAKNLGRNRAVSGISEDAL